MIQYEDEFGQVLFKIEGHGIPPNVGEIVILHDEEWFVSQRAFYPDKQAIVIILSESHGVDNTPEEKDGRLKEMKSAILEIRKRQDKADSKGRLLREQLVTIRTFIRSQQKPVKNDT